MEDPAELKPRTRSISNLSSASTSSTSPKRLFAECALVEIIHLHDCLRGALSKIQRDVDSLVHTAAIIQDDDDNESVADEAESLRVGVDQDKDSTIEAEKTKKEQEESFGIQKASELSNSVASRFHLIWSVFQAHSGAEDEFIWPALKMKIESKKRSPVEKGGSASANANATATAASTNTNNTTPSKKCGCESILEQEAYEEDHATEETMFKQINTTLRRLNGSFRYYHSNPQPTALLIIKKVILVLKEQTDGLTEHLEVHLEKEETQCLPMVKKHLTNEEISTLVGQIMGKRSAEMMGKILNLAVCSLPGDEREDMVKCLKKAMGGTFFEKWLTMGGWDSSSVVEDGKENGQDSSTNSSSVSKVTGSGGDVKSEDSTAAGMKRTHSSTGDLSKKSKWVDLLYMIACIFAARIYCVDSIIHALIC